MSSSVPLSNVISVLNKVSGVLGISFYAERNTLTLIKNGTPEVIDLPDQVPRKMLHRFQRVYEVKIELFYHPEMLMKPDDTIQ